MAKTALPITSAAIIANDLQGLYPHGRGIAQKPGGWSTSSPVSATGAWCRCCR
jgi:hypothetical protein